MFSGKIHSLISVQYAFIEFYDFSFIEFLADVITELFIGIMNRRVNNNLQLQLGASPVTSLGIVSDLVASTHSNPLWDWSILLKLLCKLLLDSECFVR
jgi:hypothetical protein